MTVRGLILRLQAFHPDDKVMLRAAAGWPPEEVGHVSRPQRGVVLIEADIEDAQARQEPKAA